METWEAIKALSENPKLKFVDELKCVVGICPDTGRVMWMNGERKEDFIIYSNAPGNVDNLHINWELVREPVDFMTAANSSKRIKHESWYTWHNIDKACVLIGNSMHNDSIKLINGKWYIE